MVSQGLFRGVVTSAEQYVVSVSVPRLDETRRFKAEQLEVALIPGDHVLVGLAEGRTDAIEIIRKTL